MKHYNIFALQGQEVTDQEVCAGLGLPQSLANTPGLNDAAIKKMHRDNYDGYIQQGMSEGDAMAKADEHASAARKRIDDLMQ